MKLVPSKSSVSTLQALVIESSVGSRPRQLALFCAVAITILMIETPTGVLNANQEHYFGLAEQAVSASVASEHSALFDSGSYRFAADWIIGHLVVGFGYGGAQVVGSLAVAVLYAGAIVLLARSIALSAVAACGAIILLYYFGSALFGGEWLFRGLESKSLAYPFVLASVALMLLRRPIWATIAAVVATYLHFEVGGYWFCFAMLALMWHTRSARNLLPPVGLYSLLVLPLLVILVQGQIGAAAPLDTAPSPDWIYTIFRAPHHAAPFLSTSTFVFEWLPGILTAGLALAVWLGGRAAMLSHSTDAEVFVGDLAGIGLGFSLIGVLATAVDTNHVLGKFMLFRPTSLAMYLGLVVAMSVATRKSGRDAKVAGLMAVILVVPFFGAETLGRNLSEISAKRKHGLILEKIAESLDPGAVVLIDPELEHLFLDIERKTGLQTYVMSKFVPTAPRGMQDWFERIEIRKAFFADVCSNHGALADAALTTVHRWTDQEMSRCATRVTLPDGRVLALLNE